MRKVFIFWFPSLFNSHQPFFCWIIVYSCITPNSFENVASLLPIFHRRWCIVKRHGVFWNVSSTCLPEKKHNHTGCICWTFLRCVFSNVSSNCLPEWMHSHTSCICLTFLHCAFSNVPSKRLHELLHSRIGCTCLIFLHCVCDLNLLASMDA